MILQRITLGVVMLGVSLAMPTPEEREGERLMEGEFFQGDIRLPPSRDRNGIINPAYRWAAARIPYSFARDVSTKDKVVILQAIADYNNFTCVRWVPRTSQVDYVLFQSKKTGCWSYVGKVGGRQELNLQSPGCHYKGIAIHEMMHAAGFWHEQSRPDRDAYVRINFQNIIAGMEDNFEKLPSSVATTYQVGYDYGSIMHYDAMAFTKNDLPTLTALKPTNGQVMGQIVGFAVSDYQRINRMYNCINYPR